MAVKGGRSNLTISPVSGGSPRSVETMKLNLNQQDQEQVTRITQLAKGNVQYSTVKYLVVYWIGCRGCAFVPYNYKVAADRDYDSGRLLSPICCTRLDHY